jgi:hypothetical protein
MNRLKRDNPFTNLAKHPHIKASTRSVNAYSVYKSLQVKIEDIYEEHLTGPDHNTASDIYGGVTNKIIEGSYSHGLDYWFNENGERKREPNKECFAEYYGRIMVPDGKSKQAGLDSIDEFLPNSRKHMDKIFDGIIGGDNH